MVGAAIVSGLVSTIVGLSVGASFGTLGGWEPVLAQAETQLGSWILAVVIGIFFALIYVYLGFMIFLPGITPVKGAIYGILVWVLLVIIGAFNFSVSLAVFASPFTGVVLHLVWGATLAMIYQIYPKEQDRGR